MGLGGRGGWSWCNKVWGFRTRLGAHFGISFTWEPHCIRVSFRIRILVQTDEVGHDDDDVDEDDDEEEEDYDCVVLVAVITENIFVMRMVMFRVVVPKP